MFMVDFHGRGWNGQHWTVDVHGEDTWQPFAPCGGQITVGSEERRQRGKEQETRAGVNSVYTLWYLSTYILYYHHLGGRGCICVPIQFFQFLRGHCTMYILKREYVPCLTSSKRRPFPKELEGHASSAHKRAGAHAHALTLRLTPR